MGAPQQETGGAAKEMPRYQSHKKVWALSISEVVGSTISGKDSYILSFAEPGYAPLAVEGKIMARYLAQVGDYYVVYDDGYASISPKKAFEEGYTRL